MMHGQGIDREDIMRKSVSLIALGLFLTGCTQQEPVDTSDVAPGETAGSADVSIAETAEEAVAGNPTRDAYFGDLHVHTRYSFDAFAFGTVATPDESYEFAKGEPLLHPAGFEMKLDRPLDFQGVTDHGMYLGMLPAMTDPESPAYMHPEAEALRNAESVDERRAMFAAMIPYLADTPGNEQYVSMDVVRSAWADIVRSANRHNDPGNFTAFIAYEYTSAGGLRDNLHRNVIFAGDRAPIVPFSRMDSENPEDLWREMDIWREAGVESIAIPHNSNGSGGGAYVPADLL